jgi:Zn-dependent peptidase ImmA (M78 family)
MNTEAIESLAESLLKGLGIKQAPVQVEAIAAQYSILIRRGPHSAFSGILIRKDGAALIGVSSSESPVRQRFTIAHELGHFFLHPSKDAFVDYRDNLSGAARTPREREANAFAAALLMPRKFVYRDCKGLSKPTSSTIQRLSTLYNVSAEAMRYRLINIAKNTAS